MTAGFANQMKDKCLLWKYLSCMLDIVILPHFFHLKNMRPDNLNKHCFHIFILLLGFHISVLLTSSNFTSGGILSDFIWEERKLKKPWIEVESLTSFFDLPFRGAFTLSILLPIIPFWSSWTLSNLTFFRMSSLVVEWWLAYSILLFDGSRHDRITLVTDFFRVYLWIVTRYVYS